MSPPEFAPGSKPHALKRTLGKGFALAATVGGVIGLGILRTPGEIAAVVPDPFFFLLLWFLGGLFALLSIAVVAELVSMTPRSGGPYPLVRKAYGPYAGFVIGWVDWLSFVADIALKAVVAVEFAIMVLPELAGWRAHLAILISTFFAVLQLRGVALGALIQQAGAAGIALILIGFSVVLLLSGPATPEMAVAATEPERGLSAWSLVAASIIFTYDGWLFAAYFSGEIKGGSGAVARACIKGVFLVLLLYMLLNTALIWSVPLASLAGHDMALARALEIAVSPAAATAVLVAAVLILLAHQNLMYMGGPRVLYALSVDGLGSRTAQNIGRRGNPVVAVSVTWAVSVVLILVGGFEFLLHLCVFFFVIIYVFLIAGVLILRRSKPDEDRPYRAWGHPFSTIFCLVAWLLISVYQAISEPETAIYALVMVAVSWPVYRYLEKRGAVSA